MNTSMVDSTSLTEAKQANPDRVSFVARCRELCESEPFYGLRAAWLNRRGAAQYSVLFGFAVLVVGQLGVLSAASASAQKPAIAVLNFELNDLTLTPGIAEEKERTASIGPMLRQVLSKAEYIYTILSLKFHAMKTYITHNIIIIQYILLSYSYKKYGVATDLFPQAKPGLNFSLE